MSHDENQGLRHGSKAMLLNNECSLFGLTTGCHGDRTHIRAIALDCDKSTISTTCNLEENWLTNTLISYVLSPVCSGEG